MSQSIKPIMTFDSVSALVATMDAKVIECYINQIERDLQAAREQVKKEHDEVIRWMVQSSEWCEKHKAELQSAQARIEELERRLDAVYHGVNWRATIPPIQTTIQNSNK